MLARANTVRNPRRTAATASALTIGLALVTAITVVAGSAAASVDSLVDGGVSADLILSSQKEGGFEQADADRAGRVDGVGGVVSGSKGRHARRRRSDRAVGGGRGSVVDRAATGTRWSGTVGHRPLRAALADEPTATAKGWKVGREIALTFSNGATRTVTAARDLPGEPARRRRPPAEPPDYVAATKDSKLAVAFVMAEDGADIGAVTRGVTAAVAANPLLQVEDRRAKARSAGQLDQLLGLVYGLLALSIIIAILGVVNTMAMSVLERTREIGLLRAVGLTRGQSRRMIRGESVMIAVLGGILGVAAGLIIGIAFQRPWPRSASACCRSRSGRSRCSSSVRRWSDPRRPGTCPASGPDGRPGCRRRDLTRDSLQPRRPLGDDADCAGGRTCPSSWSRPRS